MLRTCTMGPEPKRGDLIEIFRDGYQHWAVYVGDWYVVHLVAGTSSSKASSTVSVGPVRGQVKKDKLQDVIEGNKWKINNIYDNKYKPRPEHKIVDIALSMVGKAVEYSVSKLNCEHFATECRYGKAQSRQVNKMKVAGVLATILTVGIGLTAGAPAAAAATAACLGLAYFSKGKSSTSFSHSS